MIYLRPLEICLEIYELYPAKIFSATGLAWQPGLKKIKVKLDLLAIIDMLLMVEKGIWEGICHSIDIQNVIKNTWKIIIKIKNCHIFDIKMQIIYIVGQCHKSFQESTLS